MTRAASSAASDAFWAGATIAFVGGGTAGHLAPGLAIREELERRHPGVRSFFLLARTTPGQWMLDNAGADVERIDAQSWFGANRRSRLGLPFRLLRTTLQARSILARRQVRLLVVLGGYGSLDSALGAASLGIPIVVHEANARAGISNRVVSRLARRVCLGMEDARGDFPAARSVATGTPARREFFDAAVTRGQVARSPRVPRVPGVQRLLVLGGSLGSPFLDSAVPPLLARVAAAGIELDVLHVTGGGDASGVGKRYRELGVAAAVIPRTHDVAGELARAAFVISQAGAVALAELAAVGVPALFVPLAGHAWDHQVANLRACGPAPWWTEEGSWNEADVAQQLVRLLADDDLLAESAGRMRGLAAPGAAARIADVCNAVLSA